MNFEYDSGYGTMELSGTIWLKDGTWLTWGEYDGSEWWEGHYLPELSERTVEEVIWPSLFKPFNLIKWNTYFYYYYH